MQHAQVLHIRLAADPNGLRVSAHDRVEPDTRLRADRHIAQDNRAARDRCGRIDEIVSELNAARHLGSFHSSNVTYE